VTAASIYPSLVCHIHLNFCVLTTCTTGSGITVYNDVTGPLNLSFAIDGSTPKPFTYNKATCNYPPYCHNIAIYDIQSLTNGNHILDIFIFPYKSAPSYFAFNGAIVRAATATTTMPVLVSYSPTEVPPSQRSPCVSLILRAAIF
jgi:hypothetical protein